MTQMTVGHWSVVVHVDKLPQSYDWYVGHALLSEEFDLKTSEGRLLFVGVQRFDSAREFWKPILTVAQRYSPDDLGGFEPGVLIVAETERLFIGAGERLLAYDLRAPARLWEDRVDCGFWNWGRHGDFVWMAAELEFAVWSVNGTKLWSTFVEPPWEQHFAEGIVTLDVTGLKRALRIADGTPV